MTSSSSGALDFPATLRICSLLHSVRAMYAARSSSAVRAIFEKHLLAIILELIPAERGAIILDGHASRECDAALVERVMAERAALAGVAGRRQVLLAPLLIRGEAAGAIYLEGPDDAPPFEEAHLLSLTAVAEVASLAIENAFQLEWLQDEVARLERDLNLDHDLVGESTRMKELRERIARVAHSDTTVLITGESGTGKEVVARTLHRNSARATHPFIAINCAALTESLLESELFGHEKGAFTGAIAQKRGRLECGEGGTVFLDEIGEMPINLQAKLLRVVQSREFERVGGTRSIRLDVRVIAATNRNLEEAIRHGLFRADLFYRLNVVSLRTPPLRECVEDIVALATRFAMRFGEKCGRRSAGISPEARALLRGYDWPGNVRELENAIEHAVVMGAGDIIRAEDLPESLREKGSAGELAETGALQEAINAAKRAAVRRAFERAKNDHTEAARLLGVHPNYLYRLIRNMDLQPLLKSVARD